MDGPSHHAGVPRRDLLDGATVAEVSVLDRGRVPKVLGTVSWSVLAVLAVLGVGLVHRLQARRRSVRR